ncbi:MAG: DNRLRE domain-containing protein [Flavisolibacter sp.]
MRNNPVLLTLCSFIMILVSCSKDPVANKIPVANAGPSLSTMLPADSIRLNGSGTDADGQVVAYVWTQVSGPAASTIVNAGAASTSVRGLKTGNYVFQLLVTDDKGATGVDTMSVQVNPRVQTTVNLQPNSNPFEIELINWNGTDQSGPAGEIAIAAWTKSGTPITIRELIKFDLSGIPSDAQIISANLTLYTYPPPTNAGNYTDANFGTSNALSIQQVTSNWTNSANWFNQPSITSANQIIAPAVGQTPQDLNLDVTNMVSSMVATNANYGFYIRLVNETIYNSRIYVSSTNTTFPTKHPKLVITYK